MSFSAATQNDAAAAAAANASLFENLSAAMNGSTTDMNSLMAYAQQLAAVATAAQQFAATSSTATVARKSAPKKSTTPQKRDKMTTQSVVKSVEPTKYFGAMKHDLPHASEAMFHRTTTMNDFWANLTSLTHTAVSKHETDTVASSSHPPSEAASTTDETAGALPRECDNAERKRPAAIQELLQMKRARLSHNVGEVPTDGKTPKLEPSDESESEQSAAGVVKEKSNRTSPRVDETVGREWCDAASHKEDDTETISSYDTGSLAEQRDRLRSAETRTPPTAAVKAAYASKSVNIEDVRQMLMNDEDGGDASSRAVADLLASLNSGRVDSMQYLKAIQNYPASKLNGISSLPTLKNASTPPKSSPNRLPSRTNDSDVCESPLSSLVPHDRVFAHVPGRLSLLSNVVKYKMSVGEVKRRLMGPESFNFSLLGALLRRAKMPEKSQMLVDELNQVGLSIPRGRRRLSQVTLLSALTESESIQFAKDFQRVAESEFPAAPLAELTARRVVAQDGDTIRKRTEMLGAALSMAQEFIELLDQDRSPVMDTNPEPFFERNIHDPMFTFSMLTHGFGTPAIRVGVRMLVAFLEHQQQSLRARGKL